MASIEDLERRVGALEARVRATEVDQTAVNEKLNGVIGSLDVVRGTQREHGLLLAEHSEKLDRLEGKMDLVVDWIQNHP